MKLFRFFSSPQKEREAKPKNSRGDRTSSKSKSGGRLLIDQTLAGVKVRGKIALIVDISRSMQRDFPVLYREVRGKFPKDTPLFFIRGCYFTEPSKNPLHHPKLINDPSFDANRLTRSYIHRALGVKGLDKDKHLYYGVYTTDAIIFAVTKLKRDTVLLYNDLQDGGTLKVFAAYEKLLKQQHFTLSARSLECDGLKELKEFIKRTGGEFKLQPIGRKVSAAPRKQWGFIKARVDQFNNMKLAYSYGSRTFTRPVHRSATFLRNGRKLPLSQVDWKKDAPIELNIDGGYILRIELLK